MVNGMKAVPMDSAGRVVLPKEVRSQWALEAGDRFEIETGPGAVTLKLLRPSTAGLTSYGKRLVWDAGEGALSVGDVEMALSQGRHDRDRRASGLWSPETANFPPTPRRRLPSDGDGGSIPRLSE